MAALPVLDGHLHYIESRFPHCLRYQWHWPVLSGGGLRPSFRSRPLARVEGGGMFRSGVAVATEWHVSAAYHGRHRGRCCGTDVSVYLGPRSPNRQDCARIVSVLLVGVELVVTRVESVPPKSTFGCHDAVAKDTCATGTVQRSSPCALQATCDNVSDGVSLFKTRRRLTLTSFPRPWTKPN